MDAEIVDVVEDCVLAIPRAEAEEVVKSAPRREIVSDERPCRGMAATVSDLREARLARVRNAKKRSRCLK